MLDSSVLVLNRLYQPIHVTSVRRAFTLLYQGVARAIDREYRLFDFESWAALSRPRRTTRSARSAAASASRG